MRCIDADALEELFREVIGGIAKQPEMNGNLEHMVRASAMVIEMIQDAPTIEPQRKKGKWIYKDDLKQYFCSECGYPSLTYDDVYIYGMDLPNFCEECGADMREDAEEAKKCDTCLHEKEPWSMQCHRCENYNLWEVKQ